MKQIVKGDGTSSYLRGQPIFYWKLRQETQPLHCTEMRKRGSFRSTGEVIHLLFPVEGNVQSFGRRRANTPLGFGKGKKRSKRRVSKMNVCLFGARSCIIFVHARLEKSHAGPILF